MIHGVTYYNFEDIDKIITERDELIKQLEDTKSFADSESKWAKQYMDERNALRKQLDITVEGLSRIRYGGCDTDAQIAKDALSEIEMVREEKK